MAISLFYPFLTPRLAPSSGVAVSTLPAGVTVNTVPVPTAPAPSAPRVFEPFFPAQYAVLGWWTNVALHRQQQGYATAPPDRTPGWSWSTTRPAFPAAIVNIAPPVSRIGLDEPLVSFVREQPAQFAVVRPGTPPPVVAAEPSALPPVKFTTCSDCGAPVTTPVAGTAPAPAAGGIDAATVAPTGTAPAAPGGAPGPTAPADRKVAAAKGGAGSLLIIAGVAALIAVLLITAAAVRPRP